jgi:hypothetical protein
MSIEHISFFIAPSAITEPVADPGMEPGPPPQTWRRSRSHIGFRGGEEGRGGVKPPKILGRPLLNSRSPLQKSGQRPVIFRLIS